jgi:hypothetical protein
MLAISGSLPLHMSLLSRRRVVEVDGSPLATMNTPQNFNGLSI